MKNKILLTLAIFILSNCEIKVRETHAQSNEYSFEYTYREERRIIDSMEYVLFFVRQQSSQTGYAVTVVNLTKEKLEVELLKKQIKKFNE